jgi:hypothetical protein
VDTLITAETGSGKTLSYVLPLVQRYLLEREATNGSSLPPPQVSTDRAPHSTDETDPGENERASVAKRASYPAGVIIVPNRLHFCSFNGLYYVNFPAIIKGVDGADFTDDQGSIFDYARRTPKIHR